MSIETKQQSLASPENIRAWNGLYQRLTERMETLKQSANVMPEVQRTFVENTASMGRILSSIAMLTGLPEGKERDERIADLMPEVHEHYLMAQEALTSLTDGLLFAPERGKLEALREAVASESAEAGKDYATSVKDLLDIADAVIRGPAGASERHQKVRLFQVVNGIEHPNFDMLRWAKKIVTQCKDLARTTGFNAAGYRSLPALTDILEEKLDLIGMLDPTVGQARRAMAGIREAIDARKGEFDSKPLRLGGILMAGSVLAINLGTAIAKPLFKKGESFQGFSLVDVGWGAALLSMLYPKALGSGSVKAREAIAAEAKERAPEISAVRHMTGAPPQRVAAFQQAQRQRNEGPMRALLRSPTVSSDALATVAGAEEPLTKSLAPLTNEERSKALHLLCRTMTPDMERAFQTLLDDPKRIVELFEEQCTEHLQSVLNGTEVA